MVPLDDTHTVLDWMSVLRIPVLLVAGSYVGTISHTLTALRVWRGAISISPRVVVSESAKAEHGAASLDETRRQSIAPASREPIDVIGVCRGLRAGIDADIARIRRSFAAAIAAARAST